MVLENMDVILVLVALDITLGIMDPNNYSAGQWKWLVLISTSILVRVVTTQSSLEEYYKNRPFIWYKLYPYHMDPMDRSLPTRLDQARFVTKSMPIKYFSDSNLRNETPGRRTVFSLAITAVIIAQMSKVTCMKSISRKRIQIDRFS